jgi:hypothetical protein
MPGYDRPRPRGRFGEVTVVELTVAHNAWLILAVFLSNSIGCVLAAYCLARITNPEWSQLRRVFLAALGSWSLVESAYHNMLFVAATGLDTQGIPVRYAVAPSVVTILVLTIAAAAVLTLVSLRPRLLWIIPGGLCVGLIAAVASVQALGSIRADRIASVDLQGSVLIFAGFGVLAAVLLSFTIGATRRVLLASAIMLLGAALTVMQYLMASKALFLEPTDSEAVPLEGLLPTGAILVTVAGFVVKLAALVVVTLSDPTASIGPKPAAADRR